MTTIIVYRAGAIEPDDVAAIQRKFPDAAVVPVYCPPAKALSVASDAQIEVVEIETRPIGDL